MINLREQFWAYAAPFGKYEWKLIEVDEKWYINGLDEDGEMQAGLKPLPPGNWQIVCTSKEATEAQAKGIVETIHIEIAPSPGNDFGGDWDTGYVDYENPGEFAGWQGDAGAFRKAVQSLKSLLTSKGCDINKTYLILKKVS